MDQKQELPSWLTQTPASSSPPIDFPRRGASAAAAVTSTSGVTGSTSGTVARQGSNAPRPVSHLQGMRVDTSVKYSGIGASALDKSLTDDQKDYLRQVEHRDRTMNEVELAKIDSNVSKLKHIAIDMNEEMKRQTGVLDTLATDVDGHNERVKDLNRRMKEAHQKGKGWGNLGRNFLCMCIAAVEVFILILLIKYVVKHS